MKRKSGVREPLKSFSVSEERVRRLEKVLDNDLDALKVPELKDQILRPFKFEVPVALIKLYDKKTERRTRLIEDLTEFFFVGEVYFYPKLEPEESKLFGLILVSRFRYLLDVATYYAKKYKGQFDRVPSLSCVLFGTPFKEITVRPSRKRVRELKKVLNNYPMLSRKFEVKEITGAFKSKKPVTSIEFFLAIVCHVIHIVTFHSLVFKSIEGA